MTNFEWLIKNKTELVKDILLHDLSKEKGILGYCSETLCDDCDFRCGNCKNRTKEWFEKEHEAESKDENIKLVSYDKCKDCEHYGVWSERCWNVYECPKEVKIDAENESLSKAERKEILDLLSFIKGAGIACGMQCICDAADEIRSVIEHKEQCSRQNS